MVDGRARMTQVHAVATMPSGQATGPRMDDAAPAQRVLE